jgi:hypothetical protein
METTYSADTAHIDDSVRQAAAERKSQDDPIKVRLQPSLYRASSRQHRDWVGVSWTIDCKDADEALLLREALRVFFQALGSYGADMVIKALSPSTSRVA